MAKAPDAAKARNDLQTRLLLGSSVSRKPQTVDRYGRTVAEVIGEVTINLALVEDVMAFPYRKYLGHCDAREYLDAESVHLAAATGQRGQGGITRPRNFRRGRSAGRSASAARLLPYGRMVRCSEFGSFTYI